MLSSDDLVNIDWIDSAKLLAPHPLHALGVIALIAAAANWLVASRPTA